jgi:hypothetical protein
MGLFRPVAGQLCFAFCYMGWVIKATLRPIYPREIEPVPIGGLVGHRAGLFRKYSEHLALSGVRSPERLARSETLDRLSYRGPSRDVLGTKLL